MVIHLIIASSSVVPRIETLRHITDIVHKKGHILARDWIEPYYAMTTKQDAASVNPEATHKLSMDAIERTDLVIVEASENSFGCGYQVAAALARKKPVLLLTQKGSSKNAGKFSRSVKDPLLTRREYEEMGLEQIVEEFIKENTVNAKDLRFNFVIDRQLYNHIRWKSFKSRKTKAEIVRELLLRDMGDKD